MSKPLKKRNPSHLEQRNGLWFAILTIPKDCRLKLNNKVRFIRSLETQNRSEAVNRSHKFIARWKAEILFTREGSTQASLERAKFLYREFDDLDSSSLAEHPAFDSFLKDIKYLAANKGNEEAGNFVGEVLGSMKRLQQYRQGWINSLDQNAKTKDQMIRDVDKFLVVFTMLEGITAKALKAYIDELVVLGATQSSIHRVLISCKSFYTYMKIAGELDHNVANPFTGLAEVVRGNVKRNKADRGNWSVEDALTLYESIKEGKHVAMLNIFIIGAYTGCRINEIAEMKKDDVNIEGKFFYLPKSKTKAGIREVPIHDAILPLFKRLYEEAKDEYIIASPQKNQYENRSAPLSQRFGRIKASLGFGAGLVFHSFRGTVSTMLENAGVEETVAAHIVGHKIKTMTYGLYSGGPKMALKLEAINKISYPAPFNKFA